VPRRGFRGEPGRPAAGRVARDLTVDGTVIEVDNAIREQDAFLDIVCNDPDLLDAEFEAIVAGWRHEPPVPPSRSPRPHRREERPSRRAPCARLPRRPRGPSPGRPHTRQRGPPGAGAVRQHRCRCRCRGGPRRAKEVGSGARRATGTGRCGSRGHDRNSFGTRSRVATAVRGAVPVGHNPRTGPPRHHQGLPSPRRQSPAPAVLPFGPRPARPTSGRCRPRLGGLDAGLGLLLIAPAAWAGNLDRAPGLHHTPGSPASPVEAARRTPPRRTGQGAAGDATAPAQPGRQPPRDTPAATNGAGSRLTAELACPRDIEVNLCCTT
jgi:hypothetical protein